MYGYIYKSYCKITNKYYIGSKKSDKFVINYFGSGKLILEDIKKYGKQNFVSTLIEKCETKEELCEREMYWIDFYNAVKSDNFYNIFRTSNRNDGLKHSKESRKIISEKANNRGKMTDETKNKISNTMKLLHKEGVKFAHGNHHKLNKEARDKISKSTKNMHELGILRNDYWLGRHHTEETKRKISEAHKGKKASKELKEKYSKERKGKIYVNNGINNRIIKPEQLSEFIKLGFVKGRIGSPNKGNYKVSN